MTDPETITTGVFFAILIPTCAIANILFYKMAWEVNSQLRRAERISVLWLGFGKMSKIRALHKQFFPSSRLRLYNVVADIAFFTALGFFVYLVSRR